MAEDTQNNYVGKVILNPQVWSGQGQVTRPVIADGITARPLDYEQLGGGTGYYDKDDNEIAVTDSRGNVFKSASNDEGGYWAQIPGKDALLNTGAVTGYETVTDYSNINPNNPDWTPTSTKPDPSMAWLYGKVNWEGHNPGPELRDVLWKAYDAKIAQNPDLAGKIYSPDALAYSSWLHQGGGENGRPGNQWNIKELTFSFLNAMNNNVAEVLGSPPPEDLTKIPENAALVRQGESAAQEAFAHDQASGNGGLGDLGILMLVAGIALAVVTSGASLGLMATGETIAASGLAAADGIAAAAGWAGAAEAMTVGGMSASSLGLAAGTSAASVTAAGAAASLAAAGIEVTAASLLPAATAVVSAGGGVAALTSGIVSGELAVGGELAAEGAGFLSEGAGIASGTLPEAITGAIPSADVIGAAAGDLSITGTGAAGTAATGAGGASTLTQSITQAINAAKTSIFQPMMQALVDAGIPFNVAAQVPTLLTPMITSTITTGDPLAGLRNGIAGVLASQLGIPPALAATVTSIAAGNDPMNAIISGAAAAANSVGAPTYVTAAASTLARGGDFGDAATSAATTVAGGVAKDAGIPPVVVNAVLTAARGGDPTPSVIASLTGVPVDVVRAVLAEDALPESLTGTGAVPSADTIEPDADDLSVTDAGVVDDAKTRQDEIDTRNDQIVQDAADAYDTQAELDAKITQDAEDNAKQQKIIDDATMEAVTSEEKANAIVAQEALDEKILQDAKEAQDYQVQIDLFNGQVTNDRTEVQVLQDAHDAQTLPDTTAQDEIDVATRQAIDDPLNYGADDPVIPSDPLNYGADDPVIADDPLNYGSDDPTVPRDDLNYGSEDPVIPSDPLNYGSEDPTIPSDPLNYGADDPVIPRDDLNYGADDPVIPRDDLNYGADDPVIPRDDLNYGADDPVIPGGGTTPVIGGGTTPVIGGGTTPAPAPATSGGSVAAALAALAGKTTPAINEANPAYQKLSFTGTGDTAKFVNPLELYTKEVMENSYANPQQPQQPEPPEPQAAAQKSSSPWSYGQETNMDFLLASSKLPETMSYESKRGGLVPPLMASGGTTRHGKYAGGGLNTVNFEGKPRVDFRDGDAVTGAGDGQSDDIPAMLADGEFVFPADVVAALGNGSTKAGSDKLYDMMHSIRARSRSSAPKDLPPAAKSPLAYLSNAKKFRS